MELSNPLLYIAVFIAGGVLGALITFFSVRSNKQEQQLEKHLHQTQDELKNYQLEVTQHFSETAQLLKKMAESYRDVHNHLAQGANHLSKDGQGTPIMRKLPEIDTITAPGEPEQVHAPLDYAPKKSIYDRGTLHSDAHLEKVKLNDDPAPDNIADLLQQAQK